MHFLIQHREMLSDDKLILYFICCHSTSSRLQKLFIRWWKKKLFDRKKVLRIFTNSKVERCSLSLSGVLLSWHCKLGLLLHSFQIYCQSDNIADFLPFNLVLYETYLYESCKKKIKSCAFKIVFLHLLRLQFSLDKFFISAMKIISVKRAWKEIFLLLFFLNTKKKLFFSTSTSRTACSQSEREAAQKLLWWKEMEKVKRKERTFFWGVYWKLDGKF